MGAMVEMNLSEVKQLAQKINSYALSASQKQDLLHSIGVEMLDQTIRRFNAERAPDGIEWADYKSDDYAAFKSARGASKLVLSGGLLDSLGSDNADALEVGNDYVLAGTNKEYAAVHQFGSKKQNIEARPYLGLSSEDITDISALIDTYLRKHFGG